MQAAASAVLGALGATARDATRPEILASKMITMLDPQQAFLVNRNKIGSMAPAGESLFVLETASASYAILAANEAEVRQAARGRRRRPPGPEMSGPKGRGADWTPREPKATAPTGPRSEGRATREGGASKCAPEASGDRE